MNYLSPEEKELLVPVHELTELREELLEAQQRIVGWKASYNTLFEAHSKKRKHIEKLAEEIQLAGDTIATRDNRIEELEAEINRVAIFLAIHGVDGYELS